MITTLSRSAPSVLPLVLAKKTRGIVSQETRGVVSKETRGIVSKENRAVVSNVLFVWTRPQRERGLSSAAEREDWANTAKEGEKNTV